MKKKKSNALDKMIALYPNDVFQYQNMWYVTVNGEMTGTFDNKINAVYNAHFVQMTRQVIDEMQEQLLHDYLKIRG